MHKHYLTMLPILATFLAITGRVKDLQPLLTALDKQEPRSDTSVNLLNFLPESPPNIYTHEKDRQSDRDTASGANPSMTSKTEHITSLDVMQRFLVWINSSQPSEHNVQQARSVHMHLHTHGIHIPGFPHSNLHAQWSQLESMELTDSMKNVIHQFLETPPTPKQDTVQTAIKEPITPSAPSHTAPSTTSTDPSKYPISILVGWSAYDDPPQTPITARILGTTLRRIFGKHLCSIRDDVVKAPKESLG